MSSAAGRAGLLRHAGDVCERDELWPGRAFVSCRVCPGSPLAPVSQRGAIVAKPTIEQAQDVFEARRLIEPGVLRRLVSTLDEVKHQRLRRHLALEAEARARDDKRAIVRLSGQFHVLLAAGPHDG